MANSIYIKGARVHNLKNIELDIPHEKLIVVTGLSGSGKSTLAFDTIFAEGQRRYVESLFLSPPKEDMTVIAERFVQAFEQLLRPSILLLIPFACLWFNNIYRPPFQAWSFDTSLLQRRYELPPRQQPFFRLPDQTSFCSFDSPHQ